MPEESLKQKNSDSNEIDLIEIFKIIWASRRTIYKSVGIGFVLGIIVILGTPKEYKSEAKLLVETGSSTSGMAGLLQQFGGMAGINLGTAKGEEALVPSLYPDIVKSTPFLLEVLNSKVKPEKDSIRVSDFLDETRPSLMGLVLGYTIGLPGKIIGWIKGRNPEIKAAFNMENSTNPVLKLTLEQQRKIKSLSGMIRIMQDEETGVLSLSLETQNPQVSADMVNQIINLLTKYIIEYRVQKAKVDLHFVEDRHREAEQRYKSVQNKLAFFKDENKNVILATAQTTEQNLQAEYNLAFNIYNTLSQQLEQAKMKVQEKTPVFKVMEPAKVPLMKSKPESSIILVVMIFFGGFIGIGLVFWSNLKKKYFKLFSNSLN